MIEEKAPVWLDAGARMVAVVDPWRSTITVHRSRTDITVLGPSDTLEGSDVVPGWSLAVRGVFESNDL